MLGRRATKTNSTGADFGAGRVDDLNDVLHGLDKMRADLRIRRKRQSLRIGFGGKRIHYNRACYNLLQYFIITKTYAEHSTVAATVTVARYSIPCHISRTSIHISGWCHHIEHK